MSVLRRWGERIGPAGLYLTCLCAFLAPAGAVLAMGLLALGFVLAPPALAVLSRRLQVAIALVLFVYVGLQTAITVAQDPAAFPVAWDTALGWLVLLAFIPFVRFLGADMARLGRLLGLALAGLVAGLLWRLDWGQLLGDPRSFLISGLDWGVFWVPLAGAALAVVLPVSHWTGLGPAGGASDGSPRRILLVRLSAIGDVVFASALVGAFRRAYPEAHIAWLVQPECQPLLEHHPDLQEVIVWPDREWRELWRERRLGELVHAVHVLRAELHARRFDLAVDLQGLLKSGALTWLSGAPVRIGLGSREGSQCLMTRTIPRKGDARQIGSEYRYLAETLGLPLDGYAMSVHYGAEDGARAEALIANAGLGGGYAVLCPFTTRPQKHWFDEGWAELATALEDELGLPALLLGGPGDRTAADNIQRLAGGHPANWVGQTTLPQAAALIERANLLVAVDTGLGHMGIALRRPSLLLFGSTRPYLDTGHPDARVLYHPLACSPCRRNPTCGGAFTCMRLITVPEILEAARAVLGCSPSQPR